MRRLAQCVAVGIVLLTAATALGGGSVLHSREYPAEILGCYDADTCTFRVGLGFGMSVVLRMRLCDVYAPEMKGTQGAELKRAQRARDEALALLKSGPVTLRVAHKSSCTDGNRCEQRALDRYLAYWIAGDIDVGGTLVKRGLARWARKGEPTCTRTR